MREEGLPRSLFTFRHSCRNSFSCGSISAASSLPNREIVASCCSQTLNMVYAGVLDGGWARPPGFNIPAQTERGQKTTAGAVTFLIGFLPASSLPSDMMALMPCVFAAVERPTGPHPLFEKLCANSFRHSMHFTHTQLFSLLGFLVYLPLLSPAPAVC